MEQKEEAQPENNEKLEPDDENIQEKPKNQPTEFKKPIFVGRVGKPLKKIIEKSDKTEPEQTVDKEIDPQSKVNEPESSKAENHLPNNIPSAPKPYKEPSWSGPPPPGFYFEVLKSGTILENIQLTDKAFHTCGKLPLNDIVMAHPTISRYHAILQYRANSDNEKFPIGFYVYDLGSSHGTFINKTKIKPLHYARLKVGHLLKVGCSTRQYILQGPDEEDADQESELSLTEMKELRKKKIAEAQQRLAEEIEKKKALEEEQKKKEEEGINWGMAEDAEEEPDLAENPYAQTTNEELYLDDPKKTLRGFFEREGENLEYDCQERGVGQFVCRVELPVEDTRGNPVIAEVVHKGKKKEAVIQCALEACRILDRCGVLRQAKHESRQKKAKDWRENDYYDSDEDTFFDRTGSIEKKRQTRMQKYGEAEDNSEEPSNKPLTYDDLVEQCTNLNKEISSCETRLVSLREKSRSSKSNESNEEVDALDEFMNDLKKQGPSIADKAEISKIKLEIASLKAQLVRAEKLTAIAKPTNLPALIPQEQPKAPLVKKHTSVIIGKRLKIQSRQQTPFKKAKVEESEGKEQQQFEEEVDSDDDDESKTEQEKPATETAKPKEIKKAPEKPVKKIVKESKNYGPMRPPTNYVIPDNYYEQVNDRDLPEITEEEY